MFDSELKYRLFISRLQHFDYTVGAVAEQPTATQRVVDSMPTRCSSLCDPQIVVSDLGVMCMLGAIYTSFIGANDQTGHLMVSYYAPPMDTRNTRGVTARLEID
uniref:SFRICE_031237 n=1 Tax=Spodoptera frugiperda TaxID=7108 RepID=A0A2H1VYQ5_SPOFR